MALQGKCGKCNVVWVWGSETVDRTVPGKRHKWHGNDWKVTPEHRTKYNTPAADIWFRGRRIVTGDRPLSKCFCPACGTTLQRTSSLAQCEWLRCRVPVHGAEIEYPTDNAGKSSTDALRIAAYHRVFNGRTTSDFVNNIIN